MSATGGLLLHSARLIDADGVTRDGWVHVAGGTIAARGAGRPPLGVADGAERIDLGGATVTPGFIDLHQHGGDGAANDTGPDAVRAALRLHERHGTTRAIASFVSAPIAALEEALSGVEAAMSDTPGLLGAHLEGPFLAGERRGAHDPKALIDPGPAEVRRLIAAAPGALRMVTIAPELPGAMDAIAAFVAAGVRVAVGHTACDAATARAAFAAGASQLTHSYNAMPGIGHREPGPVLAAIDDERVLLELIVDGIHVHPDLVRATYSWAPGRTIAVTDAMAAAGTGDGDYRLGGLDVEVRGGRAVLAGGDVLAGSTLTMDAALRTGIAAGVDPVAMIASMTATPASALGLDGRLGTLRVGGIADLVVMGDGWVVERVYRAGARIA